MIDAKPVDSASSKHGRQTCALAMCGPSRATMKTAACRCWQISQMRSVWPRNSLRVMRSMDCVFIGELKRERVKVLKGGRVKGLKRRRVKELKRQNFRAGPPEPTGFWDFGLRTWEPPH